MNTIQPQVQSALQICNLALAKLGEAPLHEIDLNGPPAARLCYMHYHPSRREVLVSNRWSFAIAETTVTSAEEPSPASSNLPRHLPHALPPDCLRVLEVSSHGWMLRGRSVYCPQKTIRLRYISDVEDPTLFDPLFTDALCTLLACKLCIPLTASTTARQMLMEEYNRIVLPKAAHFNAVQSHSNDTHPLRKLLKSSGNSHCRL